jgi:prefoldin beta subunit
LLSEGKVYKLVGPALIPQNLEDAKGNVDKRLEFINKEIARLDKLKADFLKKNEEKQEKLMKLQREFAPRGK